MLARTQSHEPPAAAEGPLTEAYVASQLEERHCHELRFDCDRGLWYFDEGPCWRPQTPGTVFSIIRDIAAELGNGSKDSGKHSFLSGAEKIAAKSQCFEVKADSWDRDPNLLGTPGPTIDLLTGRQCPPSADNRITKQTSVAPEEGAPELWLRLLSEWTGNDQALIAYWQRMCGYVLTGLTTEHQLFFLHGAGGNGKSVFVNTIVNVMGEYAKTAGMAMFMASKYERHSAEWAVLEGARLVTASETAQARSWDIAKVKQATGGDPITANLMRQNPRTYRPQFKLILVGNHEPALHNVDDAVRRRFNIIPFDKKPAAIDPHLEEKLEAEHSRILQWMIDGCVQWRSGGLQRPPAVAEQTAMYFEDQDVLGRWIEDKCEVARSHHEEAGRLFGSFEKFAQAAGERPWTQRTFGSALRSLGYHPDKRCGARIWQGIRLRSEQQTDEDDLP